MFVWFVGLQMCMSSPLFGLQTCFFHPEASSGLYYMSANSKGSGETVLMCRLTRAFAGCICDKYTFSHVLGHIW